MALDTLSGQTDAGLGSSLASLYASHATDRANLEAQQQADQDKLLKGQAAAVTAVGKPGASAPAPEASGAPQATAGDSAPGEAGGGVGVAGSGNTAGPGAASAAPSGESPGGGVGESTGSVGTDSGAW